MNFLPDETAFDKDIFELFKLVPKAQTHIHSDGAPSLEYVKEILIKEKNYTPKQAQEFVKIPQRYTDLCDFLSYFYRINELIKTPEQVRKSIRDFCTHEFQDGVKYTELRTPYKGADEFRAVIEGIEEAKKDTGNQCTFKVIVVAERHLPDSIEEVFQKAVELRDIYPDYIVGVDIASDEEHFAITRFEKTLLKYGKIIPMTLHAGETVKSEQLSPPESMMKAIEFGAKRIGHGLALFNDDGEVLKKVLENDIGIETNVSSNFMIAGIDPEKHPLKRMLKEGVIASFSSDDPPFFRTYMSKELMIIYLAGIVNSWDEIKTLCLNGLRMSFAHEEEKRKLINEFNMQFEELEKDSHWGKVIEKLF